MITPVSRSGPWQPKTNRAELQQAAQELQQDSVELSYQNRWFFWNPTRALQPERAAERLESDQSVQATTSGGTTHNLNDAGDLLELAAVRTGKSDKLPSPLLLAGLQFLQQEGLLRTDVFVAYNALSGDERHGAEVSLRDRRGYSLESEQQLFDLAHLYGMKGLQPGRPAEVLHQIKEQGFDFKESSAQAYYDFTRGRTVEVYQDGVKLGTLDPKQSQPGSDLAQASKKWKQIQAKFGERGKEVWQLPSLDDYPEQTLALAQAGFPLADGEAVARAARLLASRPELDFKPLLEQTRQQIPLGRALEQMQPLISHRDAETALGFYQISGDQNAALHVSSKMTVGEPLLSKEEGRQAIGQLFYEGSGDLLQSHADFQWLQSTSASAEEFRGQLEQFRSFNRLAATSRDARLAFSAARQGSPEQAQLTLLALPFADSYAQSQELLRTLPEEVSVADKVARLSQVQGLESRLRVLPEKVRQELMRSLIENPLEQGTLEPLLDLLGAPRTLEVSQAGPNWRPLQQRLIYASAGDPSNFNSSLNFAPVEVSHDGSPYLKVGVEGFASSNGIYVEASSDGERWSSLRGSSGQYSLSSYRGKKVWLRLRKTTGNRSQQPDLGQVKTPVVLSNQSEEHRQKLLEMAFSPEADSAQRSQNLRCLQILSDRLSSVGRALDAWPHLEKLLGEEPEDVTAAFGAILERNSNIEAAGKQLALLEELRQPGESREHGALLLSRRSEEEFRQLLPRIRHESQAVGTSSARGLEFMGGLQGRLKNEEADEVWLKVLPPIRDEDFSQRAKAFELLLDGNNDRVKPTLELWQKLSRELDPRNGILEVAESCSLLSRSLNDHKLSASEAVEFIQQKQRDGKAGELPFAELVGKLAAELLIGDPTLDEALERVLTADEELALDSFDFEEDAVSINDITVERS